MAAEEAAHKPRGIFNKTLNKNFSVANGGIIAHSKRANVQFLTSPVELLFFVKPLLAEVPDFLWPLLCPLLTPLALGTLLRPAPV